MIVYCVAVLEALFYLSAVPLHVVLHFELNEEIVFKGGAGLFERRFAKERDLIKRKRFRKRRFFSRIIGYPGIVRLFAALLKNIRFDRLCIAGYFSTGDAAQTALICGSIKSIESILKPILPSLETDISPAFGANGIAIDIRGMISARSGQIMLAALMGAFSYLNGRIAQWINIPSKAS